MKKVLQSISFSQETREKIMKISKNEKRSFSEVVRLIVMLYLKKREPLEGIDCLQLSYRTFSVGSLFSGVGGIDLGFLNSGFDLSYSNEINKDELEILLKWRLELEMQKKDIDSKLLHLDALIGKNKDMKIINETHFNKTDKIRKAIEKMDDDYTCKDIKYILDQSEETKGINVGYISVKLCLFYKNGEIEIKTKGIRGKYGKPNIYKKDTKIISKK